MILKFPKIPMFSRQVATQHIMLTSTKFTPNALVISQASLSQLKSILTKIVETVQSPMHKHFQFAYMLQHNVQYFPKID